MKDAEEKWAPPDHPVFELVPPAFDKFINGIYDMAGNPTVKFAQFWGIYKHMLALAEAHVQYSPDVAAILDMHGTVYDGGENQGMPLMEHEHVAEFGRGGIPPVEMVEDIVEEDQLQGICAR